ncbi:hypothetical protein HYU15_00550 [Candidatus Woesearchaeota archaeon]|nr:hypothetical protein [Candidatus Woesearchaeota archaeon]
MEKAIVALAVAAFLAIGFVFLQLSAVKGGSAQTVGAPAVTGGSASVQQFDSAILPKGVPRLYGSELGVSYDDVSASNQQKADATISRLGQLDTGIKLNSEQANRYISIALNISCEYCCGTESIIFSNGQPACGCQHSYAMRGVAKYLISRHGSDFTDSEILEEMSKWKTLFFPSQISQKASVLKEKGIEISYTNLASNKYRGIESG